MLAWLRNVHAGHAIWSDGGSSASASAVGAGVVVGVGTADDRLDRAVAVAAGAGRDEAALVGLLGGGLMVRLVAYATPHSWHFDDGETSVPCCRGFWNPHTPHVHDAPSEAGVDVRGGATSEVDELLGPSAIDGEATAKAEAEVGPGILPAQPSVSVILAELRMNPA